MTVQSATVRLWFIVFTVSAAGMGCGAKPPYRVSESRLPSAQEIRRLGRVEGARRMGRRSVERVLGKR